MGRVRIKSGVKVSRYIRRHGWEVVYDRPNPKPRKRISRFRKK